MIGITHQCYGATWFTDGTLIVSPAIFLPSYGYPWPPLNPGDVSGQVAVVLASINQPPWKRCWFIDPSAN